MAQPGLDPARLVFIDETWASTAMVRTHGRAPRGKRLRMGVPFGHWKTTTFVAGLTTRRLIAPWVLDGAINQDAFEAYVEHVLGLELREGDTVILDNLSSHKGPRARALIKAAGASLVFLPPYSPGLNPIEMAFSKLKAPLRKAAERTVTGLWAVIGILLDSITPQECANYFQAAGYKPNQAKIALAHKVAVALEAGRGPRPADAYIRILWAAARGQGCTLSSDECSKMRLDDAIATVAHDRLYEAALAALPRPGAE